MTEKKSKEEKKAYILFNQDFNVIINVENVKWFRWIFVSTFNIYHSYDNVCICISQQIQILLNIINYTYIHIYTYIYI